MPKYSGVFLISLITLVFLIALIISLHSSTSAKSNTKSNTSGNKAAILNTASVTPSVTSTPIPSSTSALASSIQYQPSVKQYSSSPAMYLNVSENYTGVIETSMGNISFQLNAKDTPLTANNFYFLAKSGFYDGLTFHRVVKGFVIQGGDPKGDGTGGPGYKFNDEVNSTQVTEGSLAMANSGPNTNGSQFFIAVADEPSLNANPSSAYYTVFGKVTSGMDVVNAIDNVSVDSSSKPLTSVKIITIKMDQ